MEINKIMDLLSQLGDCEIKQNGGNIIVSPKKKEVKKYQPKDKELVWVLDDIMIANRILCFYDAINNRCFNYNGYRSGLGYDNYAPYEGEYPQWANIALKMLRD